MVFAVRASSSAYLKHENIENRPKTCHKKQHIRRKIARQTDETTSVGAKTYLLVGNDARASNRDQAGDVIVVIPPRFFTRPPS